ncbi:hypothetical protein AB0869_15510 [Micromonospora vinacea]|uniref:hypothetical protein n=1 Tax=Micromonospora vinacea TaxID=709878 RepID=UPI003453ADAB
MSLPAAPAPPTGLGIRFFLVGYLPTYAASLFLLMLIWADGGQGTSFKRAWQVASDLTASQIVLMTLAVLLLGLMLGPLQLGVVRFLEGAWPAWLSQHARKWHLRRKGKLAGRSVPASSAPDVVLAAGLAGQRYRDRYPELDDLVRPTGLGNILAAMEDRAGRAYGLDAVVAWPRLYPLLGPATKAVVDDRRTTLDYAARLAVTAGFTTMGTLIIMRSAGWWLLLALAPAAVALVSYFGAVRAALAYGESVRATFDLHHLDFGAAFGLPRAPDLNVESDVHRRLCDLWRQGIPYDFAHEPRPADVNMKIGGTP